MYKKSQYKIKGMQRDLSASTFNKEFAYENKNIRLLSTDSNTLGSIVNEKGTLQVSINGIGNSLEGIPIGKAQVNNELIVFTTENSSSVSIDNINSSDATTGDITPSDEDAEVIVPEGDRIYKIEDNGAGLEGRLLYKGSLGFGYKHPIETVPYFENDDIKKVYWTDGVNQPRVINIAADNSTISKWNDYSFDFSVKLKLEEEVNIVKNTVASGIFASGTIQYCFTYFTKYGQESNVFYTSPLLYISYNGRGASPEDKVSNSFDITINKIDTNFDYVRIYSIQRTSINATPNVKIVADISPQVIDGVASINYTDNGTTGTSITPTDILYAGGEDVLFSTMSQKDNTLFLGDLTLNRKLIDSTVKSYFKGKNIIFKNDYKYIPASEPTGYYPYTSQLKLNSQQIKSFKYLEHYRFGVQALHINGKWSEPVFINDARNTEHIKLDRNTNRYYLTTAELTIDNSEVLNRLYNQGYVKLRPVIVYPSINDRESICQGVLCPTVYNVGDRYNNSPFAQSSWFTRPNLPFDIYKTTHMEIGNSFEIENDWNEFGSYSKDNSIISINSKAGIVLNDRTSYTKSAGTSQGNQVSDDDGTFYDMNMVNKGAWAEFRHNYPVPSNNKRNAEIQCIWNPPSPYIESDNYTDSDVSNWVSNNSENYYIDQSIVTLHSPDIEFNEDVKSIDTSNLKLRIVGIIPISANSSDIDIQTSTPVNTFKDSDELPIGFYKEHVSSENISPFGFKSLLSGGFWFDEIQGRKTSNSSKYSTGFVVYPFHRNGSLNNTKFATDGYRSAMLDTKKMSNLKYAYSTEYLNANSIWNSYINGSTSRTGISGVSLFNSDEVTLIKVPAPENSDLPTINYYGNIDKVLNISRAGDKSDGYPIMITGTSDAETSSHYLFTNSYKQVNESTSEQNTGTDPVRIKYKTSPHAVMALNYTENNIQRILPTIKDSKYDDSNNKISWDVNMIGGSQHDGRVFWNTNITDTGIAQESIDANVPSPYIDVNNIGQGWLWIAELYNDTVVNRFGGQTEEALENNQWLPCGDSVSIINGGVLNSVTLRWEEGDTYFQRYDHIKTYPSSLKDQNSITDIISFMCETRVNIDGRYDRNRGQTSNLAITPENFNKVNEVYSQSNNFFTYRTVNPNKVNLDNFHNTITWTETKVPGELIDKWTNITLASTLDLDGDKGSIRSIEKLNNNLLAFQDRGISQIMYNESTQISTTQGVPIEIANSGKVSGKRYISNTVGCSNKWSICNTTSGIYFIDNTSKGIYILGSKLTNLSDNLGFHSWANKNLGNTDIWNPYDFNNFISYYDKLNNEVLFIGKEECLVFSENAKQFTSFYSYEHTPYFTNLNGKNIFLSTKNLTASCKVWYQHKGDYNMFFGEYKSFYTTIVGNDFSTYHKTFTNLEFRSDSFDSTSKLINDTYDTLDVWNEYQHGSSALVYKKDRVSNLKRKFRVWRANIPRNNGTRDRIKNTWAYIKLAKEAENINKTILHDIVVLYNI